MAKRTFETMLTWQNGSSFQARIEVGADGWGAVSWRAAARSSWYSR